MVIILTKDTQIIIKGSQEIIDRVIGSLSDISFSLNRLENNILSIPEFYLPEELRHF